MLEHLKNGWPLNDPRLAKFRPFFRQLNVPAKHVLLREGNIAQKMYWIEQGCIRVWFNKEGRDISFQFFFENNAVGSIESFRKNLPSYVTIETIEPCVLWYADKQVVQQLIEEVCSQPDLRALFIDAVFERTFDYMKHFFASIKDSPGERYLSLLQDAPQVIQRVPQRYIASYLGITTVHLSRIRSKLAREGRI